MVGTYKLGDKVVSESEFKKTVYGEDSRQYKVAKEREEKENDLSTFGSKERPNTSVTTRKDGSKEYYKNDQLVKETNPEGTSVIRVDVNRDKETGSLNVTSPKTSKEVFEAKQGAKYQQAVNEYNRQVEEAQRIKEQNIQAEQAFLEANKGMTAKQFFETYNVNISNDGGYSITPKPQQPTVNIVEPSKEKYQYAVLNNSVKEQKERNPIQETRTDFGSKVDVSGFEFTSPTDNFVLDEKPIQDLLKNGDFTQRPNMDVDVNMLDALSKIRVDGDNVDWFSRELQNTNFKFNQLQQADTTTELFINSPDANPQAYKINKLGTKAETNLQDYYDRENAKLIGKTAVSFVATAGIGTVAGAVAGVASNAPKIATLVKVGSKGLQLAYGTSVAVRGAKIVAKYDETKPTKTFYESAGLVAEVGGVALGAKYLASKAVNPNNYKQTSIRTTKTKTGDTVIFEKGTFTTKGGTTRNVLTRAVVNNKGVGEFKTTVRNTKGKIIKTDSGSFQYNKASVLNPELTGVYDVSSSTSATSAKTGKRVDSVSKGRVEFLGGDDVQSFSKATNTGLTGQTPTPVSKVNYNRLTNLATTRIIDGKTIIDLQVNSVGKGVQTVKSARDLTSVELPKVVSKRPFTIFEVTPYLFADAVGYAGGAGGFTGGTGGTGAPVGLNKIVPSFSVPKTVATTQISNLVASPKFVSIGGDTTALLSGGALITPVPSSFGTSKKDVEQEVFNNSLPTPASPSKPSNNVLNITGAKNLEGVEAPSKPNNLAKSGSKNNSLTDVATNNKAVVETDAGSSNENLTEPETTSLTEFTSEVISEPVIQTFPEYAPKTGIDVPIQPFIETPIPIFDPRPDLPKNKGFNGGSFDVEVRRGGRFFKANFRDLTIQEAQDVGANIVANTAGATFRIKKASAQQANELFSSYTPELSKGSFERYRSTLDNKKKGLFIEKRSARIDTTGELGDITAKGLAKIRGVRL